MQEQQLLLVDDNDVFLGEYEKRSVCHAGQGQHHRAFVVCLFNNQQQILLQKRKHHLFDGYWDVTAISHVLHLPDHDETYEEAGLRSLKVEMGIGHLPLQKIGGFNYFAQEGDNCENEYCAVLIGNYIGDVHANRDVIYEYKWMDTAAFIKDCDQNSSIYAPWTILTAKVLKQK